MREFFTLEEVIDEAYMENEMRDIVKAEMEARVQEWNNKSSFKRFVASTKASVSIFRNSVRESLSQY